MTKRQVTKARQTEYKVLRENVKDAFRRFMNHRTDENKMLYIQAIEARNAFIYG